MKKTLLILFCLNLVCALKSQTPSNLWTPQAIGLLPKDHDVLAISIVNKDVIWALADSTYVSPLPSTHIVKILKTTNGGTTWRMYKAMETAGLFGLGMQAIDSTTAWITAQEFGKGATGRHGAFKTTDGGSTWLSKNSGYASSYLLHFFDAQNGIVWNRHAIARTQNGGETWIATAVGGYLSGEGFASSSPSNAWSIIGDSIWAGTTISRIAFSPDRGVTWQFKDLRSLPKFGNTVLIISSAFKNARNGIAMGVEGTTDVASLAETSDGGATWTSMTTYPFTFGENIEYIKGTTGSFIVGDVNGLTAYTTNSGKSWVKIDSLTAAALRYLNPQTGWVGRAVTTATSPALYKWNGGNVLSTIKVLEADEVALKISPNPTSRYLTVTYADDFQPTDLTIYSASGKTVFQKNNLTQSAQMIDLQAFANGVYILQLKSGEGIVAKKIVLQK